MPNIPSNTPVPTRNIKAMLLAAGLGSRLKPWTDHHPKALVVVNGKSLLQRNVEYLQQFGIRDIIINVHHFAEQIIEAVDRRRGWGSNITISDETAEVLETGGGLRKASWFFDKASFVVLNVDILTDMNLTEMVNRHEQQGSLATLAVSNRKTSRYFLFNESNELCGWQNVKTDEKKIVRASQVMMQKAFSGIHVLNPLIFPQIIQEGKFSMVDVYLSIAHIQQISAFDHSSSKFIDVGKPESVKLAEEMFE
ncbi:MAG: sugar phosphate nucleotidyltransferase [Chitinophagaceae bacterium]